MSGTGKLIATRGLPGSGKSRWAQAFVFAAERLGQRVRVNRDELRAMLFGPDYGAPIEDCEELVTAMVRTAVCAALDGGRTVVLDETNLNDERLDGWRVLAASYGAAFEIADFIDVDVDTCIARDLARSATGGRHVGAAVIRGLHDKYLAATTPDGGEPR
jgi:predicted kinase